MSLSLSPRGFISSLKVDKTDVRSSAKKERKEEKFETTVSLNYGDTQETKMDRISESLNSFIPWTDFIQMYAEYSIVYLILLESFYSHH